MSQSLDDFLSSLSKPKPAAEQLPSKRIGEYACGYCQGRGYIRNNRVKVAHETDCERALDIRNRYPTILKDED